MIGEGLIPQEHLPGLFCLWLVGSILHSLSFPAPTVGALPSVYQNRAQLSIGILRFFSFMHASYLVGEGRGEGSPPPPRWAGSTRPYRGASGVRDPGQLWFE
jgi:hypothetical protein